MCKEAVLRLTFAPSITVSTCMQKLHIVDRVECTCMYAAQYMQKRKNKKKNKKKISH